MRPKSWTKHGNASTERTKGQQGQMRENEEQRSARVDTESSILAVATTRQTKLHMPGVEPGSQAWGACMMPLHYMRHVFFIRVDGQNQAPIPHPLVISSLTDNDSHDSSSPARLSQSTSRFKATILRRRELNPGLLRDRQKY